MSRCSFGALTVAAVILSGCASAPPRVGPAPPIASPPAAISSVRGEAIVQLAMRHLGAPYRPGGADPTGFDCGGLIFYVYREAGITLPRGVSQLYGTGRPVEGALQPGDLVFFTTVAPGPTHAGVYAGDRTFLHAPSSHGVVRVERMDGPYWSRRFLGARRVL